MASLEEVNRGKSVYGGVGQPGPHQVRDVVGYGAATRVRVVAIAVAHTVIMMLR